MSKIIRIILLLFSISAALGGSVRAGAKGSGSEFDFAKTRAFMKEMETRPDFPVSTVLANDYVVSLLALGDRLEPGRRSAVISYLKSAQQKNGGFVADKADKNGSILYTAIALETLGSLNAVGAIDSGRVKAFVASLKNPDGGFGFNQQARESGLATTYYAVRILRELGALDLLDRGQTARYVKGFEHREGGFGYVRGTGVADPKNSYMALFVLKSLGMLESGTRKSTLKFLARDGGGPAELDGQLYTILAMKELGAGERIDRKFALAFLRRLYVPLNGGFGPILGYGSTPDSTTSAVRILTALGRLKAPAQLAARM